MQSINNAWQRKTLTTKSAKSFRREVNQSLLLKLSAAPGLTKMPYSTTKF
jgi:hypothetical protein